MSERPTIYLAARYSRRKELCGYREQLRALGYRVTSRWLDGEHQFLEGKPLGREYERMIETGDERAVALRRHFAGEDWADLVAADLVVSFTEPPRSTASRGGRHVEFGAALALGKRCLVVGFRENVFHALDAVVFFPAWDGALAWLRTEVGR